MNKKPWVLLGVVNLNNPPPPFDFVLVYGEGHETLGNDGRVYRSQIDGNLALDPVYNHNELEPPEKEKSTYFKNSVRSTFDCNRIYFDNAVIALEECVKEAELDATKSILERTVTDLKRTIDIMDKVVNQ